MAWAMARSASSSVSPRMFPAMVSMSSGSVLRFSESFLLKRVKVSSAICFRRALSGSGSSRYSASASTSGGSGTAGPVITMVLRPRAKSCAASRNRRVTMAESRCR